MKQKVQINLLVLLLLTLIFGSCVSKRKYLLSENTVSILSRSNDSLYQALEIKDAIIDSLNYKMSGSTIKKTKSTSSSLKSTLSKRQEYDKKAIFIYNFTKYIEWPIESKGANFSIGVLGDEQTIKQLREFMSQKKVQGKNISVEMFSKIKKYNLVYITSSSKFGFGDIQNRLKQYKTLIITDAETSGCHISFSIDQNKIRYALDKVAIEKNGFKVGQELLHFSE